MRASLACGVPSVVSSFRGRRPISPIKPVCATISDAKGLQVAAPKGGVLNALHDMALAGIQAIINKLGLAMARHASEPRPRTTLENRGGGQDVPMKHWAK